MGSLFGPLTGFIGYFVAALRTMYLYFNAPDVHIQVDDRQIDQKALMVSVMNGKRMGGGFMMAPEGVTSDGKLDICLVDQVSRPEMFKLIPRFMKGTQFDHPAVMGLRSGRIIVTGLNGGKLPAHADGETINLDGKHLEIEIFPRAMEVIVGEVGAA